MSWHGGAYIFNPVCEKMQKSFLWDSTRKALLVTLITALKEQDWSDTTGSLDKFRDDPVVMQAFHECGEDPYDGDEDFT